MRSPVLFSLLIVLAFAPLAPTQEDATQYWKIKEGDVVDLTSYRFQLPDSKAVELKDWNDQPVLLIYVAAFEKASTDFLKTFEEKGWPEIKNKSIVCYVVANGDQIPSVMSWCRENNFTFPVATDSSKKLHSAISKVENGGYPHILMLDKDHRFSIGSMGPAFDPGSADFLKMVDDVIDKGYTPGP